MLEWVERALAVARGPDLYAVARQTYTPTSAEAAAAWALGWARTLKTMGKVLSPLIFVMMYRRNYFHSIEPGANLLIYVGIFYVTVVSMRTFGRLNNEPYRHFVDVLAKYDK